MDKNENKITWVRTSGRNKVGSVFWAIATCFIIISMINLLKLSWQTESMSGYTKNIVCIFIPIIVFYVLIAVGIFSANNSCTSIAKTYGIVTIVLDIVFTIVAIVLVFFVLKEFVNIDLVQMFKDFLAPMKDMCKDVDVDELKESMKLISDSISDFSKENPELIKEITKEAGRNLTDSEMLEILQNKGLAVSGLADPDTVVEINEAMSGLKALYSFVLCLFLNQFTVFLAGIFLKPTDARKTRVAALVLMLFMGIVGGHLIYAKRTKKAVLYIIFTVTLILSLITLIMVLVDFIKILVGKFKDGNKEYIVDWI